MTIKRGARQTRAEFRAPVIVADAGAWTTFAGLLPPSVPLPFRDELRSPPAGLAAVELFLGLQPAGLEDDLERTVDYGRVYETVRTIVESTTFNLIEALAEANRRLALDSLSAQRHLAVAWASFMTGQYRDAETHLGQVLARNPDFAWGHIELAWTHAFQRHRAQSVAEARVAERHLRASAGAPGGQDFALASLAHVYALAGETGDARRILADLQRAAPVSPARA